MVEYTHPHPPTPPPHTPTYIWLMYGVGVCVDMCVYVWMLDHHVETQDLIASMRKVRKLVGHILYFPYFFIVNDEF